MNRTVSKKKKSKLGTRSISRLINSTLFFLHHVFILKEPESFRLVVIQNKEKLFDLEYNSMEDAKIACSKLIRKRNSYKKHITPQWSFFYPVDDEWLEEKLVCAEAPIEV